MFERKLSFTEPMYPKARAMGITKFPYREYDSNGKTTYYESSDGFWIISENDSNGNTTYYKDADGDWSRFEYDSFGNQTYYETHTGYWMITEFDSNSNETYYKDGYKETFAQGK